MSKPRLILLGAGGHARACIDVIEAHGKYQIAGLIGVPEELHSEYLGYTVIATDLDMPRLAKEYQYALISVGQIGSPKTRIRLFEQVIRLGLTTPIIAAPTAHVSRHALIGAGTIVMHGAIVNAGAIVGRNNIINTQALVEHDTIIEDHCHVSTGAVINGNVRIGSGSFLGSGSLVKEGVTIGQNCLVGMGVRVRHNQADHSRYLG